MSSPIVFGLELITAEGAAEYTRLGYGRLSFSSSIALRFAHST